jgi:hypothetical protein
VAVGALLAALALGIYAVPRLLRAAGAERQAGRVLGDLVTHFEGTLGDVRRQLIELQVRLDTIELKLSGETKGPPPNREHAVLEEVRRAMEDMRRDLTRGAATSVTQQTAPEPTSSTSTEQAVLRLVATGPKTAPEIQRQIGRSREHTARILKDLYERGLLVRVETARPFVYRIGRESGST